MLILPYSMTCRHGGKAHAGEARSAHVPRLVPAGKRTTAKAGI